MVDQREVNQSKVVREPLLTKEKKKLKPPNFLYSLRKLISSNDPSVSAHDTLRALAQENQPTRLRVVEGILKSRSGETIGKRTIFRIPVIGGLRRAVAQTRLDRADYELYNRNMKLYEDTLSIEQAENLKAWAFEKMRGGQGEQFQGSPYQLNDEGSIYVPWKGAVTIGDLRFVEFYIKSNFLQTTVIADRAEVAFTGDAAFYNEALSVPQQGLQVNPRKRSAYGMDNAMAFSLTLPNGQKIPCIVLRNANLRWGKLEPRELLEAQLMARSGALVVDTNGKPISL